MRLRNILSVSVLAAAMASIATAASATPILFDNFNYPVGLLDSQGGGTGWAGNWTGADVYYVAPGSLSYSNLQQSGNRAQFVPNSLAGTQIARSIATLGAPGSTFWLSYLTSFTGAQAQNSWSVRLDASNGSILIGSPTDLNNPSFWGYEDESTSGVSKGLSAIPIVAGQSLFVAMRIDLNIDPTLNDTVSVYFDPNTATTQGGTPGVPAFVFNDLNFASSNIPLALQGNAFPSPAVTNFVANFDPIRGGTTYFDVAPAKTTSTTIPEPGTWSLMAGALALIAFAGRRRRARA